eukprot:TRINITY_DN120196_c1_g1_i1.p7 TRINITY_DN120196_c1_g1~~TRINITY_DN120196_c1_g1_i1.p7  ORF type:complete len:238 (+),score=40.00 TRINITY_DN120196_c1_g1_i1:1312-2025(+)
MNVFQITQYKPQQNTKMADTKRLVSGWLLVQADGLFFCGRWKKQFCVLTEDKDFQIRSSDKPGSSIVYIGKYADLIDAYKSFAGDFTGSFIAVFTEKVIYLRAESDSEMHNWLSHMKPAKGTNHLLRQTQQTTSQDFMSVKEFIDKNKEFWYSNISMSERASHFKDAMGYMAELLDYTFCKKNVEDCKAALGKIVTVGRHKEEGQKVIEKEEIVIKMEEEGEDKRKTEKAKEENIKK